MIPSSKMRTSSSSTSRPSSTARVRPELRNGTCVAPDSLRGAAYKTYFCDLGDQEPVVVIIQGKEKLPAGPAVAKKMQSRKVMIISKKVPPNSLHLLLAE